MKLKQAPVEVRMIAAFAAAVAVAYGLLTISFIDEKVRQNCQLPEAPTKSETHVLFFYVLLAALGIALAIVHFWPETPQRKK